MKQKYLLSMLLGGAMLTACSVEDDSALAPVAQEVNSSAPVFTITVDPLTRSAWDFDNRVIKFKANDKLSLYHGVSDATTHDYITDGFTGYGNAIYKGSVITNEAGTKTYAFTTPTVVKEGGAILVWPSDTVWTNDGTKAPLISIDKDQTPSTKLFTPYMSDVMTIGAYTSMAGGATADEKNQSAGYGRNYEIALKRAASTLTLNMERANHSEIDQIPSWKNAKDEEVAALTLDKVEIKTKNANDEPFTITTSVVASSSEPYMRKQGTSNVVSKYNHWTNQAELDYKNDNKLNKYANAITTTDVGSEENGVADTARFTLLPVAEDEPLAATEGQVILTTTYGTITLEDTKDENAAGVTLTADDLMWRRTQATNVAADKHTITKGLNLILTNDILWAPETSGTFKGENQGGWLDRWVTVDMKKLDMNGLHVDTEKKLLDALTVYDKLQGSFLKNKNVTIVLEGATSTNTTFTLTNKGWKDVQTKLGKYSNLRIDLCEGTKGKKCEVVQLKNEGETEELPKNNIRLKSDGAVIELAGNDWTWTANENKDYTNVSEIRVAKGTTLTMAGDHKITTSTNAKIVNNGTIETDGIVYLNQDLDNNDGGEINIEANERLLVKNSKKLTNMSGSVATNDYSIVQKPGGYIGNNGVLAVVEGSGGSIDNYGTIEVLSANAVTLITNNEEVESTTKNTATQFKSGYSATNRIGSIILYDKDGSQNNTSVDNDDAQGFIKLYTKNSTVDPQTITDKETGLIANYIIVNGSATGVTSVADQVKYIEVGTSDDVKVVFNSGEGKKFFLDGLIVPAGKKISIPTTSEIETGVLYVKGEITRAGVLNYSSQLTGYYGGAAADKDNIFVTK